MGEDWNPYFERKKKRNRVNRRPEHSHRYYFRPVFALFSIVFLWQSGIAPTILGDIGNALRCKRDDAAAERQMEKARIILASADAVINALQLELNKEKSERVKEKLDQATSSREGAVITIHGSISTPLILSGPGAGAVTSSTLTLDEWCRVSSKGPECESTQRKGKTQR